MSWVIFVKVLFSTQLFKSGLNDIFFKRKNVIVQPIKVYDTNIHDSELDAGENSSYRKRYSTVVAAIWQICLESGLIMQIKYLDAKLHHKRFIQ